MPGRLGDPGDGRLSATATAATAATAAAGAGTRLTAFNARGCGIVRRLLGAETVREEIPGPFHYPQEKPKRLDLGWTIAFGAV